MAVPKRKSGKGDGSKPGPKPRPIPPAAAKENPKRLPVADKRLPVAEVRTARKRAAY